VTLIERIRPRRSIPASPPEATALDRRRAELADRVAELQFDLGGLAYEMAIRDHFRLDVLLRRAAELQQADGELGEVDRLLRAERSAETGSCPACGAPHSRGAVFCWQCGESLMPAQ
jgi:chorismate mutase